MTQTCPGNPSGDRRKTAGVTFYKIRSNEVYKNYFTSPLYVKTYGKIILILNSADKFAVFASERSNLVPVLNFFKRCYSRTDKVIKIIPFT